MSTDTSSVFPSLGDADIPVLRAAEANFALWGSYTDEAALLPAGFLAQPSAYHDVVVADGGGSLAMVCAPGHPWGQPRPE